MTSADPMYKPDIAVILVNLGTPDAPTPGAVRRYLREFLSDRRVVEVPRVVWWFILNLFVLPLRPRRVARLYAAIWGPGGSPLRQFTESLARRVQDRLGADGRVRVHVAMTYGEPSLSALLWQLEREGINRVLVLPLYPQYSASTTGAVIDVVARYLLATRRAPDLRIVRDYCDRPGYLDALAASIRERRTGAGDQGRLLFSFHGIPRAYAEKGDPYPDCCAATARGVAERLGLAAGEWEMAFQSRFGRQEWLRPYTDERMAALPGEGVRALQVVCPGFAVDCLETLEEIAVENRETFLAAGGERYEYVPALNDSAAHATLIAELVRDHIAGW